MNRHLLLRAAFLLFLSTVFVLGMLCAPRTTHAQAMYTYPPEQLNQLLAPIALYPDPLLGQILMASTYPLEVIEATRWRNAQSALSSDDLAYALAQQSWEPSVKGLTAFPQVLRMMDDNLEWTERLGEAFLANQSGVMDAIQELRRRALVSGTLFSTPQLAVSRQDGTIIIEPANPQLAYIPYYDPAAVFSPWPYPEYMPYYFAPPPGAVYVNNGLFGYAAGIVIIGTLWDWDRWDWHNHRIDIDERRWHKIDNDRPSPVSGVWRHDPGHRHGVPYKNTKVREHFENTPPNTHHSYRGYDDEAVQGSPGEINNQQGRHGDNGKKPVRSGNFSSNPSAVGHPRMTPKEAPADEQQDRDPGEQPRMKAPQAQHVMPPLFESFAPRRQVKTETTQGNISHASTQMRTKTPAAQSGAGNTSNKSSKDRHFSDEK